MNLIDEIDAEIKRLQDAKKLLNGSGSDKQNSKQKRTLSPEARARIAEAQRRRWAEQKKKAKK